MTTFFYFYFIEYLYIAIRENLIQYFSLFIMQKPITSVHVGYRIRTCGNGGYGDKRVYYALRVSAGLVDQNHWMNLRVNIRTHKDYLVKEYNYIFLNCCLNHYS